MMTKDKNVTQFEIKKQVTNCLHVNRPAKAKGMCNSCYTASAGQKEIT